MHVPAGAIPKDGPSAGVTMVTALASLLSGRPVKHTVGMTGEVTLQGRVLPIGGLKQKALAAHAAGLTDVILPERNRGDLDEIPEEVREQMTFHPVMTVQEVLDRALEPARGVATRASAEGAKITMSRTQSPVDVEPVPEEVRQVADLLERRWQLSIIYAALPARCASTNSPTQCRASRRGCSPSACATSRRRGWSSARCSPRARRRSSTA